MKTTIEIPAELYRRVKAKAALRGRSIRDVTAELYERWLDDQAAPEPASSDTPWTDEWVRFGAEIMKDAPPGPSLREIIEEDRNRLERDRD